MTTPEEMKAFYASQAGGAAPTAAPTTGSTFGNLLDWTGSVAASAIWSIPETVGYSAPEKLEEWRAEHPVASIGSQLLGAAVPLVGWEYAAAKVPGVAAKLATIGSKEWPLASKIAQEGVKWGAYGGAETAISQGLNALPGGAPTIQGQELDNPKGLWNIPIAAGLGAAGQGVIGGLLSLGGRRAPALLKLFPDLDTSAPPTVRARQMFETMEKTPPGDEQMLMQHEVNKAIGEVKWQTPGAGMKYLDFPKESPMGKISSYFKPTEGSSKVRETKMLTNDKNKGFGGQEAYEAEVAQAGLDPYKFPLEGQYFRVVKFRPIETAGKVAKDVENTIAKNMDNMGDGWFVKREPNDGLHVMAKKYSGEVGTGTPDDKWLMFKTDRPGKFVQGQQFTQDMETVAKKWHPTPFEEAPDMGTIGNDAKEFMDRFDLRNYEAIARDAKSESYKGILPQISKLLPDIKSLRNLKEREFMQSLGENASAYFKPRMQQFRKNPRANYIVNAVQMTYDKAMAEATRLTTGSIAKSPNLFAAMWKPTIDATKGSIKEAVDLLESSDNIGNFWKVQKAEIPADEIATHELSKGFANPLLIKGAKMLEEVNAKVISDINKVQKATGKTVTEWRPGHYGLSRIFEGDTRVILKDGNKAVAAVGGVNKKAAQEHAAELLRQNPTWRPGETVSISKMVGKASRSGLPPGLGKLSHEPNYLQPRTGLSGYKHELTPFTKDELMKSYDAAMTARTRYQAEMVSEHLMAPQMAALKKEDPAAYKAVYQRMQDFAGTQSPWSQIQNKAVDYALAPYMGGNSAAMIANGTQKSIYAWQLGSGNLVYPVQNMVALLQTTAPELVYTLNAPAERLARDYSFFTASGSKGASGVMASLNAMKILGRSLPMMAKAPKGLQEVIVKLTEDRSLDPKAIESFVGQNSSLVMSMKEALKQPNGYVKWLASFANVPAVMSEKFARTHAATVGYIAATDYLKMTNPDDVYLFTKQFVNRTQYGYSVADKPRILTTPAGTMLGTFKNWMMNYIGTMSNYAGEAFTHNNWSPLIWQTASTAAIGGAGATPMYWMADKASEWMTDKSLMQNMYDEWGDNADWAMYGLPAALFGVSLYSQTKSPILASSPQQDATDMMNLVVWDRVKNAGTAIKDSVDYYMATGQSPAQSPRLSLELARAFLPTTVYKTMSVINDRIVSSKTNYPIIGDVGPTDRVLYAFGFHPVELDKAMYVQNQLYDKKENMSNAINKLGLQYAEAMEQDDSATMNRVIHDSMSWGVSVNSVMRSAIAQKAKLRQPALDRNYKYTDILPYLSVLGENEEE